MERTPQQQIQEAFNREHSVLVALPRRPSTDAVAAGLALLLFLQKLSTDVKVVAHEFQLPTTHRFLPKNEVITKELLAVDQHKFIISVATKNAGLKDLSYEMEGEMLNVYITPKHGRFRVEDVRSREGGYQQKLIVTLDAPSLESLGPLFEEHAEFFYETPIINIDHHASNTLYGQTNLFESNATSTSEILFELLRGLEEKHLDEHIATNLLAGIISKTKSFRSGSVTPRSLSVASALVAAGARRDEIVRHLYQTKPVATLQLWGKALAGLHEDLRGRWVWTCLHAADLPHSDRVHDDVTGVIDEVLVNTPKAEVISVLYETPQGVRALVATPPAVNGQALFRMFHPHGSGDLTLLTFAAASCEEARQELEKVLVEHFQ